MNPKQQSNKTIEQHYEDYGFKTPFQPNDTYTIKNPDQLQDPVLYNIITHTNPDIQTLTITTINNDATISCDLHAQNFTNKTTLPIQTLIEAALHGDIQKQH